MERGLNEESETGQYRGILAEESVVPTTALIMKSSWLRLQSIMTRLSAMLPIVGTLINTSTSSVPSPLLSYTNSQPVATVLSYTVHVTFSIHWPSVEISRTWYPWMWLVAEEIKEGNQVRNHDELTLNLIKKPGVQNSLELGTVYVWHITYVQPNNTSNTYHNEITNNCMLFFMMVGTVL